MAKTYAQRNSHQNSLPVKRANNEDTIDKPN